LGPISPEYHAKPRCKKYAEPSTSNRIAFLDLSSKQTVEKLKAKYVANERAPLDERILEKPGFLLFQNPM
jgi:hypothetical protein